MFNVLNGFNTLIDDTILLSTEGAVLVLPQAPDFFQVRLNVNKCEVIGIDISEWADSENIDSVVVTTEDNGVRIVSSNIEGGRLMTKVEGLSEGVTKIRFNYATRTRQDCFVGRICVEGDC